jgi:tetratricopeptide (TPR) repeat protein
MNMLGNGLNEARHNEDALSVREAELAMYRHLGSSEENMLILQGNLASAYRTLGRLKEALSLRQDVYSGNLKLYGEEHPETLREAVCYAMLLLNLDRFEEHKSLMRKMIPISRRVLGEDHDLTLRMRWAYAQALYEDDGATPNNLREALTTLEDAERTARRVLSSAHPIAKGIEGDLRQVRGALRPREAEEGVNG